MSGTKYELSERQVEQLIGIVENAVAGAIRAAVSEVLGYSGKRRRTRPKLTDADERLAKKIIATLEQAQSLAEQAPPGLQKFLALKAMPKTMLRRRIGNSYKNFDAVLERMVADGRLLHTKTTGPSGRVLLLFGLP